MGQEQIKGGGRGEEKRHVTNIQDFGKAGGGQGIC